MCSMEPSVERAILALLAPPAGELVWAPVCARVKSEDVENSMVFHAKFGESPEACPKRPIMTCACRRKSRVMFSPGFPVVRLIPRFSRYIPGFPRGPCAVKGSRAAAWLLGAAPRFVLEVLWTCEVHLEQRHDF